MNQSKKEDVITDNLKVLSEELQDVVNENEKLAAERDDLKAQLEGVDEDSPEFDKICDRVNEIDILLYDEEKAIQDMGATLDGMGTVAQMIKEKAILEGKLVELTREIMTAEGDDLERVKKELHELKNAVKSISNIIDRVRAWNDVVRVAEYFNVGSVATPRYHTAVTEQHTIKKIELRIDKIVELLEKRVDRIANVLRTQGMDISFDELQIDKVCMKTVLANVLYSKVEMTDKNIQETLIEAGLLVRVGDRLDMVDSVAYEGALYTLHFMEFVTNLLNKLIHADAIPFPEKENEYKATSFLIHWLSSLRNMKTIEFGLYVGKILGSSVDGATVTISEPYVVPVVEEKTPVGAPSDTSVIDDAEVIEENTCDVEAE